tara:strand:+ start:3752 stop:3982 length:231 start_codon:yes stop_codon:yes gene_type:complete
MNEPLTRISIFLLIFYMGWYLWDQSQVIQDQKIYIEHLEKELITRKFLLGEYNIQMLPQKDLQNPINSPINLKINR